MNSFEMTRRFHVAFGLGAPKRPIEPTVEDRILRAKLLLEETLETIEKGLGLHVHVAAELLGTGSLMDAVQIQDRGKPYDPVETLDGIADVKVIANGTGVLFGLPVDVADRLVFESNMSKLDENGKPIINECKWPNPHDLKDRFDLDPDTQVCEFKYRGVSCTDINHLIDPTQPIGKVLKSDRYKKVDLTGLLESLCDGHTASSHDPKICGKCATHIDGLRP